MNPKHNITCLSFLSERTCEVLTHQVAVLLHIETSQIVYCANQLTGFHMRATLAQSFF